MKMKTLILAGVLTAFLALGITPAYAGGECALGGKSYGGEKHGDKYGGGFFREAGFVLKSKDALSLSADQVTAIQALHVAAQKDAIQKKADAQILELDLRSKMHGDVADLVSVNNLIDQKYEIKKAQAKALAEAHFKLREILNDQQKIALKDLVKEKMKARKAHFTK
jgi:Spy/CpxP family protein refolding chaperone